MVKKIVRATRTRVLYINIVKKMEQMFGGKLQEMGVVLYINISHFGGGGEGKLPTPLDQ